MGRRLNGACGRSLASHAAPAFLLFNSRGARPQTWPWRCMRKQPNDTAPSRELAEGGALVVARSAFVHRSPTMPHGINHRFEA